jgi:hypothetical protein
MDEELAKKRASDLVRQMKSQMGGETAERHAEPVEEVAETVEKTIGRRTTQSEGDAAGSEAPKSKPAADVKQTSESGKGKPAESDVPEKTIGRMRPKK